MIAQLNKAFSKKLIIELPSENERLLASFKRTSAIIGEWHPLANPPQTSRQIKPHRLQIQRRRGFHAICT
jgi:hypothetical protein